jgi:hypothetical protein
VADPTDLQTLCLDVLTAAEQALDTIPGFAPGLEGAPARTFVSAGQPALDCCNQLSVNAATIREGATAPGGLGAGTRHRMNFRLNHVGINVWITRCLDTDQLPPPVTALTALAEQVNADGWALWNHLWNLARSGDLVSLCDEVFFDALTPLQPSGGCSGWLLNLRVELHGYESP